MNIFKACIAFLNFCKFADIQPRIKEAVLKYEQHFNLTLKHGPYGTMGQIFFRDDNPNIVVKFTKDQAEAKNMAFFHHLQKGDIKFPANMEYKHLKRKKIKIADIVRSGIVTIENVFGIRTATGPVYVIEQEKGQDVPLQLANKLMFYIGQNIARQTKEVFTVIQEDLADKDTIKELSEVLAEALIESGQITIEQKGEVNVGDLGTLLRVIREKVDSSFKDFRPSNMLVVKDSAGTYRVKLTDIGYGSGPDFMEELQHKPIPFLF
ncbi:MAG: hypothetical protein ACOYLO_00570 [Ferruginibacter sp.]